MDGRVKGNVGEKVSLGMVGEGEEFAASASRTEARGPEA